MLQTSPVPTEEVVLLGTYRVSCKFAVDYNSFIILSYNWFSEFYLIVFLNIKWINPLKHRVVYVHKCNALLFN